MQDLNLTAIQFSLLSSTAYLLIYGIMQVPVGIIVDKFGLKKSMLFAIFCCSLANLGFASTHGFYLGFLFRVCTGFGCSFGFICVLIALYDWMPRKNIAFFIGISQLLGTLGPMIAGGPLNTLAENQIIGWRSLSSILAVCGLLLMVLVFLFVDKNRQLRGSFVVLSRPTSTVNNLRILIRQPQIWFIAVYSAGIYFSLEYLSENEGKHFLMEKGFSSSFSSYMITMAWLGFALGAPILGYVSDLIKRRKPILFFSGITTTLTLFAIIYLPLGAVETLICFFLLGVGVGSASVSIVMMGEQCKSNYLAAGLGFENAVTMVIVSLVAPAISGLLMKIAHSSTYSVHDYQHGFILLVLLPAISVVLLGFFIKETFGKSTKENTKLNWA